MTRIFRTFALWIAIFGAISWHFTEGLRRRQTLQNIVTSELSKGFVTISGILMKVNHWSMFEIFQLQFVEISQNFVADLRKIGPKAVPFIFADGKNGRTVGMRIPGRIVTLKSRKPMSRVVSETTTYPRQRAPSRALFRWSHCQSEHLFTAFINHDACNYR